MKSYTLAAFATALALAPYVAAHGSVHQITIDGKAYQGPAVGKGPLKGSPIRAISEVDPVKGATNPNLACGQSAQLADSTVPANPGSKVELAWINGQGGPWPHNAGPIINYMASCGSDDCSKFDASQAKWFKIEESGIQSDGTWEQAKLMAGAPFTLTLPTNLKPGGYLLRHEIISLQLAMSPGGYESYPSCSQLLIGGNGNGTPDDTVSFPGAYNDNDPGLLVDIYDLDGKAYQFPGGPVSNLASKSADGMSAVSGNNASPGGAAPSAAAPAASSTPATPASSPAAAASSMASAPSSAPSPASTKTCSKKKRMAKRHARHYAASH